MSLYNKVEFSDLRILTIVVFSIWFVIISFTPLPIYAMMPIELFEPLGVYRLFFPEVDSFTTQFFLSEWVLITLKILLLVCLFLCIAKPVIWKWIIWPTTILLFITDAIVKGFNGFVNHSELSVLYSLFIFAFFLGNGKEDVSKQNGNCLSRVKYVGPIFLVASLLTLSYSFVGIHRVLYGGFEQFINDAMFVYLTVNSLISSKFTFDFGLLIAESSFFLRIFKGGFILVTLFEIFSPFVLISKFFRLTWVLVMVPFHMLSLFTMNIFFWENLFLIVTLFVLIPYRVDQRLT